MERVSLYTRDACHLCDGAREVVAQVCAQAQVSWREVNIDSHPDLVREYGEYVPVVEVDGVRQGFWRIDPRRLARLLA